MRKNTTGLVPLAVVALALLPLQADSVQPNCFNPTSSLASTVRGPTAGDEQFFTLPVGPSNIMFILDSSGSMQTLPQCGDNITSAWGGADGPATCQWPISTVLNIPSSAGVTGTCDVSADPNLAWMSTYVPTASLYDPGHGVASTGLSDQPTWGIGCAGNNCLFQADKIYSFNSWAETSATPKTTCNTTAGSNTITPSDSECRRCLFGDASTAAKGFYFYAYKAADGTTGRYVVFSGAWLNANPPKFMAARKVIKDMVWMDPVTPSALDSVRFGLAILGARIIVPLGPDKPHTFPPAAAEFKQARQYMLDALNRKITGVPSFMSGSTPMATTLFGVGQYFSSPGKYTAEFGSTFESASLQQSTAGAVNAPWAQSNPNQCSICWGCQQNSIIIVTDGSPNSESALPATMASYDQNTYTSATNCGPGTSCQVGAAATCPALSTVSATNVIATDQTAGTVGTPVTCTVTGGNCRCPGSTKNRSVGFVCGYDCPGSTTLQASSFACYATCPGDATQYASGHACYSTCAGDTTHYPPDHGACYTTCAGDTTHHPLGYTCPCSCTNDSTVYTAGQVCPTSMCCSPSETQTHPPTALPRIASWLHSNDLRTDLTVANPQQVSTYTVSFGLSEPAPPTINPAVQLLKATANMGNGRFNNASDATSLSSAVATAVRTIVERANSFSAPAAASLSTLRSVAVEAVLTRFKPNDTATWEGHVYQGMLFDEFLNGCDPTKGPTLADGQPKVRCGNKDIAANFDGLAGPGGTADCSGVFLVDADCDEIAEDPNTGAFLKKGQGGTPANLFWDAGFVLSNPTYPADHPKAGQAVPGYRSADARTIYSVVNGTITPFNVANASTFAPYMSLTPAWCAQQLQLWGICGSAPLAACTSVVNQCATAIVNFVHGWDLTDIDGDHCGAPGRQSNATSCPKASPGDLTGVDGEQRDRANDARTSTPIFWKLGDVFHSAPVVVRPPRDEFSCSTGFENQCTATIYSPRSLPTQTKNELNYTGVAGRPADAYEAYRLAMIDRPQLVLVGSNDGMLHAFDAGSPDPALPGRNALGVQAFTRGTGEELWAFIPPDLLPRLKDLTQAHQYMVDGNVMVKDVWVDGSRADGAVSSPRDNEKQYDPGHEEFHTVAVITERSGGTQYTALDITDVLQPKFLWTFPPPGSDDTRYMGQSWSDFAPGPPPIGPVRLALGDGVPDPTHRGFEERWIVFVNGGYDPTLTRGRAVWMVDVWTGGVVWRFTDDDFKADMGYGSGTSMFPVTATVGAVDIGDPSLAAVDHDGFFDTATWGDLGGNLFVARFWTPGVRVDETHPVTNWHAARSFEQQRTLGDTQNISGRSPFFFMADNVFDPTTRTLRTALGSGNRARSMTSGNECTADNLLGCCTAGCTNVRATFSDEFGTCTRGGEFRCAAGVLQLDPTSSTCGAPLACGSFTTTARLQMDCPGAPGIDITAQMSCDDAGVCQPGTNLGTTQFGTMPAASTKSRFYGVWSFGGSPAKMFDTGAQANTAAQAKVFDANRFTDVSFTGCTGPTGGTCKLVDVTQAVVSYNPASPLLSTVSCAAGATCQASSGDAGWYYQYGEVCPLGTCDPAPPWFDEKTGAPASTVLGCTSWGSFRPVGALATGTDPCAASVGTPQTYAYMADFMTGAPTAACGYQNTTGSTNAYVRATQRNTVAAPNAQTIRVVVSPSGEVKYQGLEFPPGSGAGGMVSQTNYGTRTDTAEMMYWLEVSRDLHNCRHASAASCE
jgi:type IV pilus assembly protein PilY1